MRPILNSRYFPDRKALGFGLVGLLAFVITILVSDMPFEEALILANVCGGIAMYVLPPSAHDHIKRVDEIIKDKSVPLTGTSENENV